MRKHAITCGFTRSLAPNRSEEMNRYVHDRYNSWNEGLVFAIVVVVVANLKQEAFLPRC